MPIANALQVNYKPLLRIRLWQGLFMSEGEVELYAETALIHTGSVAIGETPHIVEAKNGKYVIKPDTNLHIRLLIHWFAMG